MTDKSHKVFVIAHIDAELAKAFTQHIRDFDVANPGNHFEIMHEGPDESTVEMIEIMQITPGLKFSDFFKLPQNIVRSPKRK